MKMFSHFLIAALILTGTTNLFSQSPYFRQHQLPQEFKNASISCVLQDKNHFIWFGTTVGLVRFNGLSYKHFLQFPAESNEISTLFQDSKGTLWIGYKNGKVGRFQHESFKADSLTKFPTVPITGFAETRGGEIWASTYGEGFMIFDGDKSRSYTDKDGLADNFVYGVKTSNEDVVYGGTDQGLYIIDQRSKKGKVVSATQGLRDNIITTIARDADGKVWLGSESEGVAIYDPSTDSVRYPFSSWPYGRITSLLLLEEVVWIGTATNGVIEADRAGKFLNKLSLKEKPASLRISDLIQDFEGNIWIANSSGTVLLGNRRFAFIDHLGNKDLGSIQSILFTRDGQIVFSASTGVYSVGKNADSPVRLALPELKNVQVISLFQDERGGIWFGTFDKGVYHYNTSKKKIIQYTEKDGLVNNNVLSIGGKGDEIWFATLGGVSQCHCNGNNAVFRNYTSENGLGSNYIYQIFIDSKNRIWFATDGKGVSVLEKGAFKTFSISEGLSSNIVYSVTEDSSGTIWISTSNAGIFRFNGKTFESFTPHNTLRDLQITSIIGAANGGVLLVSRSGVDVLDPKTGTVFYYGSESGIEEIDPNLNAYSVDPEKNIWLATQAGIIKYNTRIRATPRWPVTRINEMQIFLSKADSSVSKVPYNRNHISFDYAGFWYHDPEKVSYKIKLQGYDHEWTNSRNHFITYPNLQPGDYTFMVQASATDHFEGAPVTTYSFTISPPFYSTLWFYLICLALLASLLYIVITTREKNLRARQLVEKEKIEFQFETLKNQVNPHFLFNSFNTLIGVIEEDKDTAVEYVIKLSDFYRDILVNREKDTITLSKELELINNYYFLQIKRYKENLRISIDVLQERLNDQVPPLTLQLLVENAIKHNIISKDKPLHILITTEGEYLLVRNNLQRKVLHEASTGVGLSNITNRLRLLTAKPVRIEETTGYFTVYIPLLNF